jgi:hypothetical protein
MHERRYIVTPSRAVYYTLKIILVPTFTDIQVASTHVAILSSLHVMREKNKMSHSNFPPARLPACLLAGLKLLINLFNVKPFPLLLLIFLRVRQLVTRVPRKRWVEITKHTDNATGIPSRIPRFSTALGTTLSQYHPSHNLKTNTIQSPPRPSKRLSSKIFSPPKFYEGRLQSSWTHLIITSRNSVEVRWRSLFRSTSLGKRCTSYNAPPTSW